MGGDYDIYALSVQRDKQTIETFLDKYTYRDKVENREGEEISIYKNERNNIEEMGIAIKTLSEVIEYGIMNTTSNFVFYIGPNLKADIKRVMLIFTGDKKIIFGISIDSKRISGNDCVLDNYDIALDLENSMAELTNSKKSVITWECPPADDESEFDCQIEDWKYMKEEKMKKGFG